MTPNPAFNRTLAGGPSAEPVGLVNFSRYSSARPEASNIVRSVLARADEIIQ